MKNNEVVYDESIIADCYESDTCLNFVNICLVVIAKKSIVTKLTLSFLAFILLRGTMMQLGIWSFTSSGFNIQISFTESRLVLSVLAIATLVLAVIFIWVNKEHHIRWFKQRFFDVSCMGLLVL
ncbi:hypothetical protein ACTQ54_02620 [Fundicoccus sp. Sow4_H7]|uniref:hypothetical protein n=1 Tax=Fundicoccus sp. Sow4_H7 TaxID=3438784 RepID=UPI003F92C9EB